MKKILFVDDEVNTEKMNSRLAIIEKESGYEILKVDSVEKVMSIIDENKNQIGLIILDIIMPPDDHYTLEETDGGTTTGIRLLKDIRAKYSEIPIIIVSIKGINSDDKLLTTFNISEHFEKSISASTIANAIKRIMSKN